MSAGQIPHVISNGSVINNAKIIHKIETSTTHEIDNPNAQVTNGYHNGNIPETSNSELNGMTPFEYSLHCIEMITNGNAKITHKNGTISNKNKHKNKHKSSLSGNILDKAFDFDFNIWKYIEIDCIKNHPLLTLGMYTIINAPCIKPLIKSNNSIQNNQNHTSANHINHNNNRNTNNNNKKNNKNTKNINNNHKSHYQSQSQPQNNNICQSHCNTLSTTNNNTNKTDPKSYLSLEYCANFLYEVEKTYPDNPYHNRTHAADVAQFAQILLSSVHKQKLFSSHECLAIFLGAAGHDAGHPGRNNDFLIKSNSKLLEKHSKPSVLENFHIYTMFDIIKNKNNCNFLETFTKNEQKQMESMIKFAILGTDMATYHQTIRKELNEPQNKPQNIYTNNRDRIWNDSEREFMGRAILHMSDISNPLREFSVAKEWGDRVLTEFFAQGDEMKKMGLEVSFGCDREKVLSKSKSQLGFIDIFVLPLAKLLGKCINPLNIFIENNFNTHDEWENEAKREQDKSDKSNNSNNSNNSNSRKKSKNEYDMKNLLINNKQTRNNSNKNSTNNNNNSELNITKKIGSKDKSGLQNATLTNGNIHSKSMKHKK